MKHSILRLAVILVLVSLLVTPIKPAQANGYSISGTVVDTMNNPVPGIEVFNFYQSTTTDANGYYVLTQVPSGGYTVTLRLPEGYISYTRNVTVNNQDVSGIDFVIKPNVDGTILWEDFSEPGFNFSYPWVHQNDAYAIINGELNVDGLGGDPAGRVFNAFVFPAAFSTTDYLEFSFRCLLKGNGNPQEGRGILFSFNVGDLSQLYRYDIRVENGYTNGPPTNPAISLIFDDGYYNQKIVDPTKPVRDQSYHVKAIRSSDLWYLYIDDNLIGKYPDTIPHTHFIGVLIVTVGSVILDDLSIKVNPLQAAPTVNSNGPYSVQEGSPLNLTAFGSDLNNDVLDYKWDLNYDGIFETLGQSVTYHAIDGPMTQNVSVQVTDPGGLTGVDSTQILIDNVAPSIDPIIAPTDPIQINQTINMSADFFDPGILDTHSGYWDWGDGSTSPGDITENNGSGTITGEHIYTTPGVYPISLIVTDKDGDSSYASFQYIVVYDPNGGFVTGGGWINSPQGAYVADPSLTGKANFGFVSKYQKGKSEPAGVTEFQFKIANLNFHSSAYEWLVVSGAKAKFKGTGTINGEGNYKFLLSAIDGQLNGGGGADKFRIKIWWEDEYGIEHVVYDNQLGSDVNADPTTILGGGSIVIHKTS